FNAKYQFLNEATDSAQHLFMTGGLTLFQGISASSMTINMGGASAGNVLGHGFYNVQFGSNGGSLFTIILSNAFYGCGTAIGGNGTFGDGIKDLVIWTNTVINYNTVTYSGTSGPNSLMDFATLATPWGWDISVGAIPEPTVVGLIGLGGLLVGFARFRRRA
ncbi:MAG: PEP-CTERM sorting domain-containing protein, partial [Verrucomicrobiia bacterium]